MSGFSAPAQVASQIASAIGGLFRRGAISASTGLTDSTLSYAGESYAVPTAIVPYAIGEVPTVDDEVVTLQVNGQPALLGKVVRSGLTPAYSPIPVVSSLPTASATYRGVSLRTAGATGVQDATYTCLKAAGGTYSWVVVATPAASLVPASLTIPFVSALPTATVLIIGEMVILAPGGANPLKLYVCLESSSGTPGWVQVATG